RRGPHVARPDGLPFRVVRVGFDPPADGEVVALLAIDDMSDRLGRLAESDGQNAGRQRIERARVTCLFRLKKPLEAPQRLVRRYVLRLVEDQPTVNIVALAACHVSTF